MKRVTALILYIIMTMSICVGVSADALTKVYYPNGIHRLIGTSFVALETMRGATLAPKADKDVVVYAEDGRSLTIPESEVTLYENVGWFKGPVTKMYAPPDRTLTVKNAEIELYQSLGWYLEPVSTMHALDGRTLTVINSEIELYKSVGWYTEPVMTVYATDGRTLVIFKRELEAYINVGWYRSPADFPSAKLVALTFDDGPSTQTPRILDCLEKYGAKATFFVTGRNANVYQSALKRAHSLGMEIGNHTTNHPKLTTLSGSAVKNELNRTSDIIFSVTGIRPALVRPPYGSYNNTVCASSGAPLILWSIDTLDWKTRNADKTVASVLKDVKDGSIVLMHDLYAQTASATERIVPELISRGYKLVTVSELAKAKGYSLSNGKAYRSFY